MKTTACLFDEKLLTSIRDHFLYVDTDEKGDKRIFLDIAAGNFKLKTLPEIMARENSLPGQTICDLDADSVRIKKILAQGEEDWRIFLNASDGVLWPEIAASSIIARLIFTVAENVPGTNIVTTHLEHPCSGDSARQAAEQFHKELRVAPVDHASGRVTAESILNLIDENTCLLTFCNASNASGAINDAETICKKAREINPDIYIVIDGVQYAPIAPVDVDAWKPDAYVFGPYKLTCARGYGLAYLSERMALLPHRHFDGFPDNQWLMGSKNHANYAAFIDTMNYLCWLGSNFTDSTNKRELTVAAMHAIKAHLLGLAELTALGMDGAAGLKNIPGVNLYAAEDLSERSCLLLFDIDGWDANDLVLEYCKRGIHVRARHLDTYAVWALTGLGIDHPVIRVSASHCTSPEEIKEFLLVTAQLAAEKN